MIFASSRIEKAGTRLYQKLGKTLDAPQCTRLVIAGEIVGLERAEVTTEMMS